VPSMSSTIAPGSFGVGSPAEPLLTRCFLAGGSACPSACGQTQTLMSADSRQNRQRPTGACNTRVQSVAGRCDTVKCQGGTEAMPQDQGLQHVVTSWTLPVWVC